mmetsp:Transcript_13264/g.29219  ORF Transcript_13264/g.29219 Transcript_13264/m.29219 type:complete len:95 (+) Transcript_13264:889-1173(+)
MCYPLSLLNTVPWKVVEAKLSDALLTALHIKGSVGVKKKDVINARKEKQDFVLSTVVAADARWMDVHVVQEIVLFALDTAEAVGVQKMDVQKVP